jgi:hypothetical protein
MHRLATKTALVTSLAAMQQGIDTMFTPTQKLTIAGQTLTAAQASAQIDAFLQAIDDTTHAKLAYQTQLAAQQTSNAAARVFLVQMDAVLTSFYGKTGAPRASFGALPQPRAKPTVEVVAAAVEKRIATRKARHTMGKRQKAKVVAPVPVVAAAAPVVPPPAPVVAPPAPIVTLPPPTPPSTVTPATPSSGVATTPPASTGTGR